MKKILIYITTAFLWGMLSTVAVAQPCDLTGTLLSTPEWDRPFADGTCCSGLGPVSYHIYGPFAVTTSGSYDFSSVQAGWDGYAFLYEIAFDPTNQTVNFVAGDDDGNGGIGTSDFSANLTAGTEYFFITTGFANGDMGDFTTTITGPGTNLCPPVYPDPTISQTDGDGDGIPEVTDPCACLDPQNILDANGSVSHFHDFVVVVSIPGETWEITASSGTIFTAGLAPIPLGTVLPEISPGVYRIDLYHPNGVGFNVTVDRTAGGGGPFPLMTGGLCNGCQFLAIPTMGEWGLMILALLLLSFATVFMIRRQTVFAGLGSVSSPSASVPFDRTVYGKMLVYVMAGITMVFTIAVVGFGYEMTTADVPGSLIAGAIAAYLCHLIYQVKNNR